MNVREVGEQLQRRIGVDPLSLGANVLANIVTKRMRILKLTDPEHYAAHVRDSAEEWAALIDDVVVSETWFFRGGKVFSFLAERVRQATSTLTFRILSAPCSTGEEPYSMAIALLYTRSLVLSDFPRGNCFDPVVRLSGNGHHHRACVLEAGVPRERWSVEGIDLSAGSLARARQGVYREMSFREMPAPLRRKYFHECPGGRALDPSLRSMVRYRQGNLIDPKLLQGEPPFDLIFCRNVLIYLHAEARQLVLANLDRLLAPQGLLCMGHAEPLSLLDPRFEATGPHSYFLFQRKREGERRRGIAARAMPMPLPKQPPSKKPAPRPSRSPVVSAPVDLLVQARREADAGSLDKALQTCRAYLAASKPSAPAYSLLGVIHQARHEKSEAVECFRRALYLDPQHEEALLHLLLLYQQEGNEAAAQRLRRRLERKTAGGEA